MDLKSGCPFWPIRDGLPATYPALDEDLTCEVVVLGAGISGALVAHELTRRGMNVVVLDRRDVGQGSTSATTGLLQYEIDVPLCELIRKIGREQAERAYQLCLEAIGHLEQLTGSLAIPCGFSRKISLYAASRRRDVASLRDEQTARQACGIDVEFVEGEAVQERFPLSTPALLVSPVAAVCDAFAMTHGLLQQVLQRGGRIYDRTEAASIRFSENEVRIRTDRGPTVTATEVIFATGYEAGEHLKENVVQLHSTYALITQPLENLAPWNPDWIYWETARPYFYLRTTEEGRLLVGGEDDPFRNPARRDARIPRKMKRLLKRLSHMLPELECEAEYSWAGTFGQTKDGLACIGPDPRQPRALFALGFGGNGITFSQIAAQLLADHLTGRHNPDAEIFRLGR